MTWVLVLTNPATRALRDAPRPDAARINATFEEMRRDPYSGDIKFLKGTDRTLRRRIGVWRILFTVHPDRQLIVVLAVLRRDSNSYSL